MTTSDVPMLTWRKKVWFALASTIALLESY